MPPYRTDVEVVNCDILILHNVHLLPPAMQSVAIQLMKLKTVPSEKKGESREIHANSQLVVCTRYDYKPLPYTMMDSFITDYIFRKDTMKALRAFVGGALRCFSFLLPSPR